MMRISVVLVALVVAISLGGTALAGTTDGSSAANAIPLTGSALSTIVGNGSGSFQYYRIDYPGKNQVGTLTFYFTPTDPTTMNAVGINVYQGSTTLATQKGTSSTPGAQSLSFQSPTPGQLLVQVYDYHAGVSVNYNLVLSGITLASPSGAPIPTPTQTPSPSTSNSVSGVLVGSAGGSYAGLTVPYTAGSAQAVQVNWYSTSAYAGQNYLWVVAWQNGNKIGQVHVSDQSTPGSFSFFYNSPASGPVLVQLGYYAPGQTINYTLSQ